VISRRYHQFENVVAEEPVNYVISMVVAWQVLNGRRRVKKECKNLVPDN